MDYQQRFACLEIIYNKIHLVKATWHGYNTIYIETIFSIFIKTKQK